MESLRDGRFRDIFTYDALDQRGVTLGLWHRMMLVDHLLAVVLLAQLLAVLSGHARRMLLPLLEPPSSNEQRL